MSNDKDLTIKVNDVFIPTPTDIEYNLGDIDADSERDVMSGVLYRNRIRDDVVKLSLLYSVDSLESITLLLNAISGETFNVEYFDIKENARINKSMYASSKTFRPIKANGVWIKGFKVNLTEV